jgi:asparagine synthetase B (glutamine-hydrolysing)
VPLLKRVRRRLSSTDRAADGYSREFLRTALRHANRPAEIGAGFHSVQARSIYLQARSKYHVHCLEWNNKIAAAHGLEVAFPFMDRDLLAYLIAIPGDMQNRGGVPRAILREAMRGVLPEPLRLRNWKANFTDVVNSGVARDASIVAQALSRASLAVRFGYLDADRLEGEVARLKEGLATRDCVASWSLADLFGLEVWLQVFFGERAAQPSLSSPLAVSSR